MRRALVEKSQQIQHQQDHQNGAYPDASAAGCAPAAVAVVSSAAAEDQHQHNDQNDNSHLTSPFLLLESSTWRFKTLSNWIHKLCRVFRIHHIVCNEDWRFLSTLHY